MSNIVIPRSHNSNLLFIFTLQEGFCLPRLLWKTCSKCSNIIQCWCKLHMHCSDFWDCYSRCYHACNSPLFLNMNDYFFRKCVILYAYLHKYDYKIVLSVLYTNLHTKKCNYTWTQTFVAWHCIGLWARGWSSSSWWSCSKTPQCNTRPTLVQNTSL